MFRKRRKRTKEKGASRNLLVTNNEKEKKLLSSDLNFEFCWETFAFALHHATHFLIDVLK